MAVWQLARVPFEAPLDDAVAAGRDLLALERTLGIAVEPDVVRWVYARPDLLAAADWFYSHMDGTLVVGVLAAAAIWVRPRSPLAWATALYPALVLAVVVGTANHFFVDAVIGAACAAHGVGGALSCTAWSRAGGPRRTPRGSSRCRCSWPPWPSR